MKKYSSKKLAFFNKLQDLKPATLKVTVAAEKYSKEFLLDFFSDVKLKKAESRQDILCRKNSLKVQIAGKLIDLKKFRYFL